jgi:hypothetical protein
MLKNSGYFTIFVKMLSKSTAIGFTLFDRLCESMRYYAIHDIDVNEKYIGITIGINSQMSSA